MDNFIIILSKTFCLDINKYIKELIIKNECIILSGFGGFETHYMPAHKDEVTGKMVPPSKQVVFRQDFKKDNGILVGFIAEKEGISLDKAREIIDDYIGNIVYKLDIGGSYVLEELGKFIKKDDGRMIFIPLEKQNFLIDSYGLSEVSIPAKGVPEERTIPEKKPVRPSDVKHSNKAVYLILLAVVILSALVFIAYQIDLPGKIKHLVSGIETGKRREPEKIVFGQKRLPTAEDSIASAVSGSIDESTDKEKALFYHEQMQKQEPGQLSQPKVASDVRIGDGKKYVIVAGSFHAEAHAVDLSNQLRYKGYKPLIIKTENGLYRVVLDSFKEINMAIDEMTKYKRQLSKDIWILRI